MAIIELFPKLASFLSDLVVGEALKLLLDEDAVLVEEYQEGRGGSLVGRGGLRRWTAWGGLLGGLGLLLDWLLSLDNWTALLNLWFLLLNNRWRLLLNSRILLVASIRHQILLWLLSSKHG